MRAKQFIRKIYEAIGDSDVANAVVAEVIELIGQGHTEVSPDVITTKVSAALGRPFMLKDLVAANNSSPELQHYIDSINPSKIKFSTDILTVKNQDPMKEKQAAQDGVARMAAKAAGRPRLGESQGISQDKETKFHKKLDTLVHDTFGKRKEEMKEGWGTGNDRVSLPDRPNTYFSGTGPLQKEYDALYAELVPSMGKADTVEGEVLRAASKIIYRHYNDGDEFNQASFDQLKPYIGHVTSYDDLAHKATMFAAAAEGEYHPNPNWDSLDVMEYGPEEEDEDYDDEDEYYGPRDDEDEDLTEEYNEVDEGWAQDSADAQRSLSAAATDRVLQKYQDDPELSAIAKFMSRNNWTAQSIDDTMQGRGKFNIDWWKNTMSKNLPETKQYPNEGRDTPLRDIGDYNAKKKALQDIQTDPHTSKDAELNTEVMRRLAGLEQQRKDLK